MESNSPEESTVLDINSLYVRLEELTDKRNARGMRYQLVTILVMLIMAKLSGEDTPSEIAEWRAEQFVEILKLKRKNMPHHSTYRRIEE